MRACDVLSRHWRRGSGSAILALLLLLAAGLRVAAGEAAPARRYAPDRELDLLHVALDITPDFRQRTIAGKAVLRFQPIARSLQEVRLDAVDLRVSSVESSASVQAWQVTADKLVVTYRQAIPAQREVTLTIQYTAEPREGLYFRTPEMGYRRGETHLFTQGEAEYARFWYPGIDHPNERFTSEIICRVPEGMIALSNGRRVSSEKDGATGRVAFHWVQERTHVNYLMALVAGYFQTIEDRHGDLPLAFHTLPSEAAQAAGSFRGTKQMLAFFELETGVPYPWAKYDQVCVNDFVAGGMENTSLTILTDGTLFSEATGRLFSSEGLVAHELAHQWFGDLVTCKDWSQLWLNEGFATYYESLYLEQAHGRDEFQYEMYQRARDLTAQADDTRAIVRRTFGDPGEMFNHLTYPKGSWVLHMLRCQLGADLYRRCIRTYLERHAYQTVVTEDLNAVIEELSGRSWDPFFDQWVYHGGYPELEVHYDWNELQKLAKVSIAQRQKASDQVLLFRLPLTVRFDLASGTVDHPIELREREADFFVPLPEAPARVRVDPEQTVLARIRFEPPGPLLEAQLTNRSDVVGRLLAVEILARRKDQQTVDRLRMVLQEDPFHGVREEASKALRAIHTDAALGALIASRQAAEETVRLRVVEDLGDFFHPDAFAALREVVAQEKNPEILAVALEGLGRCPDPDARGILLGRLDSESYRNRVALGAIRGLRRQEDPAAVPAIQDCLARRESDFTSDGMVEGLEALAYLARDEEKKDSVREFLLARVNHPKGKLQLAAIRALGTLGDAKAIPALEAFASAGRETAQREPAERALAEIRGRRRPSEEVQRLRGTVLELEQANRDARRQFEELRQKVEALKVPAAETNAEEKEPAKKRKR